MSYPKTLSEAVSVAAQSDDQHSYMANWITCRFAAWLAKSFEKTGHDRFEVEVALLYLKNSVEGFVVQMGQECQDSADSQKKLGDTLILGVIRKEVVRTLELRYGDQIRVFGSSPDDVFQNALLALAIAQTPKMNVVNIDWGIADRKSFLDP